MVYEPRADYEQQIVDGVVAFIEERFGEPLPERRWLDREIRDAAAVELIASGPARSFVLEHTRLSSFNGQIGDDARLLSRLWPILPALDGTVPGRFELAIRAGDIAKLSERHTPRALAAVVEWVLAEAPRLDAEREADAHLREGEFSVTAKPGEVPFELRLTRLTTHGSEVFLVRLLPPDFEEQRARDVTRALAQKNPKLAAWAEGTRTRVLILEIRDFQLQSADLVARALKAAARARSDMPELVFLVETDFGPPWSLYVLKEGDKYLMQQGKGAGPFPLPAGPVTR